MYQENIYISLKNICIMKKYMYQEKIYMSGKIYIYHEKIYVRNRSDLEKHFIEKLNAKRFFKNILKTSKNF